MMEHLGIVMVDELATCTVDGCGSTSMGVFDIHGKRVVAPCRKHSKEMRRELATKMAAAAAEAFDARSYPDLDPETFYWGIKILQEKLDRDYSKSFLAEMYHSLNGRLSDDQFRTAVRRIFGETRKKWEFPSADEIVQYARRLAPAIPQTDRVLTGGDGQMLLGTGS